MDKPLEIRFRNNSKLLNIEKEEEPIDIDSLTPEQMKELLKKMMGQQKKSQCVVIFTYYYGYS